MPAQIEERRFQGEPALTLVAGEVEATFLPNVGMTGVSWRHRGAELLAVPGGVAALKQGRTGGIPLLAPWANRLSSRRFRVADVDVDLDGLDSPTDDNGLPIHGLLLGSAGWSVDRLATQGDTASLTASIDVHEPAFPLPHRITVRVRARPDELELTTTVTPTGARSVPAAFGWHPYLRLRGEPRRTWTLHLPGRRHLALDHRGIPTGREDPEEPESRPIGRRTFDDLYALERQRRLSVDAGAGQETGIELDCGPGYAYAQVWVPPRRPFVALEPMVARTDALVDGTAPLVPPGDDFTARFSLRPRVDRSPC